MTPSIIISIVSVCFAIISWLITFSKNTGKDTEERVIERTEMNCKLDMINSNVVDIKNDNARIREELKDITNRVVIVEQSCKSAHHRLDTIEGNKNATN